jgi:hypothetical protein
MLEKTLEKKVGDYVKSQGGLFYKFSSPSLRAVPDRLVILPENKIFFIEFKQKGKCLSKLQQVRVNEIRRTGALVYVVDDVESGMYLINSFLCL